MLGQEKQAADPTLRRLGAENLNSVAASASQVGICCGKMLGVGRIKAVVLLTRRRERGQIRMTRTERPKQSASGSITIWKFRSVATEHVASGYGYLVTVNPDSEAASGHGGTLFSERRSGLRPPPREESADEERTAGRGKKHTIQIETGESCDGEECAERGTTEVPQTTREQFIERPRSPHRPMGEPSRIRADGVSSPTQQKFGSSSRGGRCDKSAEMAAAVASDLTIAQPSKASSTGPKSASRRPAAGNGNKDVPGTHRCLQRRARTRTYPLFTICSARFRKSAVLNDLAGVFSSGTQDAG